MHLTVTSTVSMGWSVTISAIDPAPNSPVTCPIPRLHLKWSVPGSFLPKQKRGSLLVLEGSHKSYQTQLSKVKNGLEVLVWPIAASWNDRTSLLVPLGQGESMKGLTWSDFTDPIYLEYWLRILSPSAHIILIFRNDH